MWGPRRRARCCRREAPLPSRNARFSGQSPRAGFCARRNARFSGRPAHARPCVRSMSRCSGLSMRAAGADAGSYVSVLVHVVRCGADACARVGAHACHTRRCRGMSSCRCLCVPCALIAGVVRGDLAVKFAHSFAPWGVPSAMPRGVRAPRTRSAALPSCASGCSRFGRRDPPRFVGGARVVCCGDRGARPSWDDRGHSESRLRGRATIRIVDTRVRQDGDDETVLAVASGVPGPLPSRLFRASSIR